MEIRLSTASMVDFDRSEQRVICSKFENVGRQRKYLPRRSAEGKNSLKIALRWGVGVAP